MQICTTTQRQKDTETKTQQVLSEEGNQSLSGLGIDQGNGPLGRLLGGDVVGSLGDGGGHLRLGEARVNSGHVDPLVPHLLVQHVKVEVEGSLGGRVD